MSENTSQEGATSEQPGNSENENSTSTNEELKFKYKYLMEEYGIEETCPFVECLSDEKKCSQWVVEDINSEKNFLPKIIKHSVKKIPLPPSINSSETKCMACGLSMYNTPNEAKVAFNGLNPVIQKKLGYTHIAEGTINEFTGVYSSHTDNGHFTFFEYSHIDLKEIFKIVDTLE